MNGVAAGPRSPSVVLVTGGTGGLGRVIVEALTHDGARVAFTFHRNAAAAESLARATGSRAVHLDLHDASAPGRVVDEVESALGPLDGLVNNAGLHSASLLAMTSDADWSRVIDTNLGGVFRCCRAALPGMMHRRRGSIVNVASLSALHGIAGQAGYSAAKAGVAGLTRALAREVGPRGVRVNAIAPGFVSTEMTSALSAQAVAALRGNECLPTGVEPRCVARTVVFLLSDQASSITGQLVAVDAGASA